MNIVTNEKMILDNALEKRIFDKKPTTTIRVLMKHYFSLGKNRKEVKELLENHMRNLAGYHPSKWDKTINAMIKTIAVQSHDLNDVGRIEVVQGELDKIVSLNDMKLERLAFVMLVYAKVKNRINPNNRGWVNQGSKLLLREAGVSKARNKDQLIFELVQRGLITPTHVVDREDIQVNFVMKLDEPRIVISDFREIVNYYLQWKAGGTSFVHCSECRLLFPKKSNNSKYCPTCKRSRELAWKRENMKRVRLSRVE